jgi:hypothetical protein
MMRYQFSVLLALLIAALPLPAQRLESAQRGVARASVPPVPCTVTRSVPSAGRANSLPRWPFILGGAVVGAGVAGMLIGREVARSDDGMILPVVPLAGIVVAGAGVGALGGWTVSAVIRHVRD